jgi:acyl-CoA reductase-like NAD-dependent aldehyde dehydrogenase
MTKNDRTRQPAALTPAQKNAAELLASGLNDKETAALARVSRQTLNGWKNHNAAFQEAIEANRADLVKNHRERLYALTLKAFSTLERAMDEKLSVPAALGVIRATLALDLLESHEPPQKTIVEIHYGDEGREAAG